MNKTYVWMDVLYDYTSGDSLRADGGAALREMAVVIASDDDAARDELIRADLGDYLGDGLLLDGQLPTIYLPDTAPAWHVNGKTGKTGPRRDPGSG